MPGTRYFVVAAGVGVDAHLFYKLHSGTKHRLGMAAYYAKAWHLWFTYPMTRFRVEYTETGSDVSRSANLTELLGIRIRHFGGVLRELAPGASLDRNDVRLILCRTASRLAYLSYVTRALLGRSWQVPGIDLAHASKTICQYLPDRKIRHTAKSTSKPTANFSALFLSKSPSFQTRLLSCLRQNKFLCQMAFPRACP